MKARIVCIALSLYIVLTAGCARRGASILGATPGGEVVTIAEARSTAVSTPVTLRGTMFEK